MLYLYSTVVLFFSPTSTFTSVHIFDEFSTFTPINFLSAASLLVSLPSRSEFMVAITTVASHFTVSRTRSTWRNVCKGWEDRSFCSLLSLFRSAACLACVESKCFESEMEEPETTPSTSSDRGGGGEEEDHPWPYLQSMFSFAGVKDNSYKMKCLLCLPRDCEILAFKNSPSNLKKHIKVSYKYYNTQMAHASLSYH